MAFPQTFVPAMGARIFHLSPIFTTPMIPSLPSAVVTDNPAVAPAARSLHPIQILPDLNATAKQLGAVVADLDLFSRAGEVVFPDDLGNIEPMTGRKFRTWISDHVTIYRKVIRETGEPIPCSLKPEESATILECGNFQRFLKQLPMDADKEGGVL